MKIGVLALQGGFSEHMLALKRLGVSGFEIRKRADIVGGLDGLILPGGESTVISRLLKELGLFEPLKTMIGEGLPVFGTCAGMILLAQKIENGECESFQCIGIGVKRNAFGRQLGSFTTIGEFSGIGKIPMTFIRAPYIETANAGVEILATVNGRMVAAQSGNVLVSAFHPELTNDLKVHQFFLQRAAAGGMRLCAAAK